MGWMFCYSCRMSSSTFQSSKELSAGVSGVTNLRECAADRPGRYLRMTKGIFFAASSFNAISNGSVSPSTGTNTGAFIL